MEMTIKEVMEKLAALASKNGEDVKISLAEVSYDRYGNTIGLVVGEDKENPIMSEYFGGEMPQW